MLENTEALGAYIDRVGVLPLFDCGVPGFSAYSLTRESDWWTGDPDRDPWTWREQLARGGKVVYAKLTRGKSAFVSRAWYPALANRRRDGYDFDARWEDGKAKLREYKVMRAFAAPDAALPVWRLRELAEVDKGFEDAVTSLQMQCYLVCRRMERRLAKNGEPKGWPVSVYSTPEALFGVEFMEAAYREEPEASFERVCAFVARASGADPDLVARMLK